MEFAVNEPADATPDALVVTVNVLVLLLNVPDAPVAGAVNVTLTPATGFPATSSTTTESGVPNAVRIAADCGVVPVPAVILCAAPAVLVKAKFTVVSPVAAAVTV